MSNKLPGDAVAVSLGTPLGVARVQEVSGCRLSNLGSCKGWESQPERTGKDSLTSPTRAGPHTELRSWSLRGPLGGCW